MADTQGGTVDSRGTLGNISKLPSTFHHRRNEAYQLQDIIIGDILTTEETKTLRVCLRYTLPNQLAYVMTSKVTGKSHLARVMMCKNKWGCPVCAEYYLSKKRQELARGLKDWRGSLIMGAFTVGHHAGDKLTETKDIVAGACGDTFAGYGWQKIKERYGIEGYSYSNEVTWGRANGWHPHRHYLFISSKELTPEELTGFESDVRARYGAQIKKRGGYIKPIRGVLMTARTPKEAVDYVFKNDGKRWKSENELLSGDSKSQYSDDGEETGLTPFDLVRAFRDTGDRQYANLFQTYYYSFRGCVRAKNQKGLAEKLHFQERSDNALIEEAGREAEKMYEVSAVLTKRALKVIRLNHRLSDLVEVTSGTVTGKMEFSIAERDIFKMDLRIAVMSNGVMSIHSIDEPPPYIGADDMKQIKMTRWAYVYPSTPYTGGAVIPGWDYYVYTGGKVLHPYNGENVYTGGAVTPQEAERVTFVFEYKHKKNIRLDGE